MLAFRIWANSLGIEGFYINNLYEDIKDGLALLKLIDKVQPGIVDWKKVEIKPNMRVKEIHNSNYAVELGKQLQFSLVGIGGIDIVDGNKKLILAIMWQLVRKHTLRVRKEFYVVLLNLFLNLKLLGQWTEDKLLSWALERVCKEPKINSFKDPEIKNCLFLFNLLATIEPRAIDWRLVNNGKINKKKKTLHF